MKLIRKAQFNSPGIGGNADDWVVVSVSAQKNGTRAVAGNASFCM